MTGRQRSVLLTVVAPLLLAPLAACTIPSQSDAEEKVNFLPLVRYEKLHDPAGYNLDILWPLARFQQAGDTRHSRIIPFYYLSDEEKEDFLNVLILYWQTLGDDETRRTLFPFFHSVQSEKEDLVHIWPLYGRRLYESESGPARTDSVVWPLFEYDRSRDRERFHLGILDLDPLVTIFGARNRPSFTPHGREDAESLAIFSILFGLFSLFDSDQHELSDVPGPEVADNQGNTSQADTSVSARDLLNPLLRPPTRYAHTKSDSSLFSLAGIFRLYDSRSYRDALFERQRTRALGLLDLDWAALYSRLSSRDMSTNASELSTHLFPFWFSGENESGSYNYLLPFGGAHTGVDGSERQWWLPPLLSIEKNPSRDFLGVDAPWPLWRYATWGGEDPGWHLRLLPLLWFTKKPTSEVSIVAPVYIHIRDGEDHYRHFLPLYGTHEEKGGARTRTFILPPLYIHTEDQSIRLSRREFLYPLTRFETSDGGTRNWIFPLFYQRSRGPDSHLNILGLYDRKDNELRERTMFYPFYGSAEELGSGERYSLLPIADWRFLSGEKPEGKDISVLYPLANFSTDGIAFDRWIFPFYWWYDDGVRESHRHIWPFFGMDETSDGLERWSTLFPLFFHGKSRDETRGETGFLYPLGFSEWGPEREQTWAFPFYYHRHGGEVDGPEERTWFLWPLYSHTREKDGSEQWHSLFELLKYEKEAGEMPKEEFKILGGLYGSTTQGDDYTQSVAFLYRYEKEGNSRTLNLFHLIPIHF